MKQSTMPDAVVDDAKIFENLRPSLVINEASTEDALPHDQVAEYALQSISNMQLKLSNKFEDQWISKYMACIFPWALKYACGGPEYPYLFGEWHAKDKNHVTSCKEGIQSRWRRVAGEAFVTPGIYAQMLAQRPETQISGDFMLTRCVSSLICGLC